jgi:biopolymer transport protein ExbD
MNFSEPFASNRAYAAPGRSATGIAFASAGLALVFNLVLALGILPAFERHEREIPLELTSVSGGTAPLRLSAREVVVKIDASGAARLGGRDVDLATLEARLTNLVREGGETALTLRIDARAPHGAVARIFAAARKAGIRDAAILTVDTPGGHEPLE